MSPAAGHRVAFVPLSPALLPQVAGTSPVLDDLRAAVAEAIAALPTDRPVTVIAPGPPGRFPADHGGDLRRFGRPDVGVPGGVADLPWPAVLGRLLLAAHGIEAGDALLVDGTAAAPLPDGPVRALVLGDGTACRTAAAPGGLHPDAMTADARFAAVLGSADPVALAGIDADPALRAAGVPAWRSVGLALRGRAAIWSAAPVVSADPLGVGCFVTVWTAP